MDFGGNNMSYFPEDIPFMSEEELKYYGIKIPKDESNKHLFSFIPTEEEAKEILLIDKLKESLCIHGKWIPVNRTLYQCSQCGAVQLKSRYCKNCKVKMEENE